jgi:hypothetical protein
VQNQATNALVRYRPSPSGALVPQLAPPRSRGRRLIAPGPLSPGSWTAAGVVAPFHIVIDRTGWLEFGYTPHDVEIGRFDAPLTEVAVTTPTEVFTPSGGVRRPTGAAQILRLLAADPHLVVRDLPDATISGVRARQAIVTAKPYKGYPTFCPRPCVAMLGMPNQTNAVDTGIIDRISILTWGHRVVVVIEQTARSGGSLATTAPLVHSLRFTR